MALAIIKLSASLSRWIKLLKNTMQARIVGVASSGRPLTTVAASAGQRRGHQAVATLGSVTYGTMERPVVERLMRGKNRYIDVMEGDDGMPLYRACGQNGAICRYTIDLWQAEIYVQYYEP